MASALHLAPNLDSAVGHASISNQGVSAIPQPETVGQNVNQIQNAHEESQAYTGMVSRKRDAEEAQEESHAKRLRTDAAEAVALVDSTSSPGEANAPPVGNPDHSPRRSARSKVLLPNTTAMRTTRSRAAAASATVTSETVQQSQSGVAESPAIAPNPIGAAAAPSVKNTSAQEPSFDASNSVQTDPSAADAASATSSASFPSQASSSSLASNPYAYLAGANPYAYYLQGMQVATMPSVSSGYASWSQGTSQPSPPHSSPTHNQQPLPQTYHQPNHSQAQESRQPQPRPKRLKAHTVTTKTYNIPLVPRDTSTGKPLLPLNVGIMTVINLGEICPREHFHTERYIFPVGYEVTRRYLSTRDKNIECVYHCTILDGGDGPKFQIIPSDAPDQVVIAGTATGAWSSIVRKANQIRERQHSNSVSGPDFFGLGQNTIKHLIQELPGADRVRIGTPGGSYVWQNFVEGGPLGGRHAAVIPALPEDYTYDSQKVVSVGAWYAKRPGPTQPLEPTRNVNGSYYPPHLAAQQQEQQQHSTESTASQPHQHQPGPATSPQCSSPVLSRPPSVNQVQTMPTAQQPLPIPQMQSVGHQLVIPNQPPDAATLASIMNAALQAQAQAQAGAEKT